VKQKAPGRKALRFQAVLDEFAPGCRVVEFDEPSRTARQAAAAIGCELDQIVKSLLFRTAEDEPLLVLTAGGNRADEAVIARQAGTGASMGSADFVREHSGYAIGGVPPFGHPRPVETLVDEALLAFEEIWAAGGTPNTVFAIAPRRLLGISGGRVIRVS